METERLALKLYAEADKNHLLDLFTEADVMRHVDKGVMTRVAAENLWRKLFDEFYARDLKTIWAVFAHADSRYVGHASLRPRPSNSEEWEIVYLFKLEEWNKGFGGETARALVNFGFSELNLPQIYATIDDDNAA